ncbi:MAG: ferredoxin--NADP reductase [Thermoplasmata archaeon]
MLAQPLQPPHRRVITLLSNDEIASSTYVLTFGLSPGDPMDFLPGQYVTFYLQRDGKSVTRSYSIFSSANRHDRVSLLIKKVPLGFASHFLCGLSPLMQPTLNVLAPLGRFVLRDPEDRTVVLVATGVGLAPFIPMLERLWKDHPECSTWLFYGNRCIEDIVHRKELELLAQTWPGFHFVPVLSRPPADGSWTGAGGHVEEHVQTQFPDLSHADVYLCGVNRMVNQMQELALELQCPKGQVFVDRWGDHEE